MIPGEFSDFRGFFALHAKNENCPTKPEAGGRRISDFVLRPTSLWGCTVCGPEKNRRIYKTSTTHYTQPTTYPNLPHSMS